MHSSRLTAVGLLHAFGDCVSIVTTVSPESFVFSFSDRTFFVKAVIILDLHLGVELMLTSPSHRATAALCGVCPRECVSVGVLEHNGTVSISISLLVSLECHGCLAAVCAQRYLCGAFPSGRTFPFPVQFAGDSAIHATEVRVTHEYGVVTDHKPRQQRQLLGLDQEIKNREADSISTGSPGANEGGLALTHLVYNHHPRKLDGWGISTDPPHKLRARHRLFLAPRRAPRWSLRSTESAPVQVECMHREGIWCKEVLQLWSRGQRRIATMTHTRDAWMMVYFSAGNHRIPPHFKSTGRSCARQQTDMLGESHFRSGVRVVALLSIQAQGIQHGMRQLLT